MADSAHDSTTEALEKLLDLLNGNPADPQGALAQVEQMLEDAACAREIQEAGATAAALVEHLLLPALRQDPPRLERARAVQDYLIRETNRQMAVADSGAAEPIEEDFLEKSLLFLSEGMPVHGTPPRTEDLLPQSLAARLAAALHLVGESETALRAQVTEWQNEEVVDWTLGGQILEQIRTAGHKAATPPWQRHRRAVYDILLRIAQSYGETLVRLGRKEPKLAQLLDAVRQFALVGSKVRAEGRRFHGLLHAQGMELQKEARSLRARQEEGRRRAEQFKQRVDQLEAALARTRREQFLDPMTGVPDRYAFMAHLHRHLDRALHLGETFSLLLFHFYELQQRLDGLGQGGGPLQNHAEQRLLLAMIQEMRPYLPESAFLARLSTERMVVLLPKYDVQEVERMGVVVGRILEGVSFVVDGQEVLVQASFGCAAFQAGMDIAQMLETTDRLAAAAHSDGSAGGRGVARRVRSC
ncbi:MAG: GGDEF domain-containing protein [Magnetococcales bacterium]|nr:GGDEF domain-containing protein [Magnetococcales bacterium]